MSKDAFRRGKGRFIRTVRVSDLKAIWEIEQVCFGPEVRFSFESFVEMALSHEYSGIVAEADGKVVAFAFLHLPKDAPRCTLVTVNVLPDYRREGMGRSLVRHLNDISRGLKKRYVELQVSVENEPALALYHSIGFEKVTLEKNFYPDGQDAWVMEKKLNE